MVNVLESSGNPTHVISLFRTRTDIHRFLFRTDIKTNKKVEKKIRKQFFPPHTNERVTCKRNKVFCLCRCIWKGIGSGKEGKGGLVQKQICYISCYFGL